MELVSSEGTPLEGGFVQGSPDYQIVGPYSTVTDAAGLWSLTLIANVLISPANTYYRVIQTTPTGTRYEDTFAVPNTAGPFDLADILYASATIAASGAAPSGGTFLVTTAHASLPSAMVVGPTPGGELGGTWANPTVDASHSGSTHAAAQAAAEATAAAALVVHAAAADPHPTYETSAEAAAKITAHEALANPHAVYALDTDLSTHEADTTAVHGITDTANLALLAEAQTQGVSRMVRSIQPSAAGVGPFTWLIGGVTFEGQYDPVSYFGYNNAGSSSRVNTSEPSFVDVLEAKYKVGSVVSIERYWEYFSDTGAVQLRPWFMALDRATHTATMIVDPNTNGSLSFSPGGTPAFKFILNQLEMKGAQEFVWSLAGAHQFIISKNAANTLTKVVLSVDGTDQILIAGSFAAGAWARLICAAPFEWAGGTGAGWQSSGKSSGGQNNNASGQIFDWLGGRTNPWGMRLYAGRWDASNLGGALVALNSSGIERTYLRLDGEGQYFTLGTGFNATTGAGVERIRGNATGLGFFAVTPVARPSAYTQTYASTDKTHANPTATALTDNSAGTPDSTIQALADGTVYATDVAAIRNNFADLAAKVNALIVDLADSKQLQNSVIDDLQALGLLS